MTAGRPAQQQERHSPRGNHLLAALAEYERMRPHLQLVALPLGRVLHESGSQVRKVYFPVSGLVSLLSILGDGSTAQMAVVGNDGCVGVTALLGGGTTPFRAVVTIAGYAYQIDSAVLGQEFRDAGSAQLTLLHYIQALVTQASQNVVCNRRHSLRQQLCRWLLLSLDRLPTNEIHVTQELLATMLGVRRAGVTKAASELQVAGLIGYKRGLIAVPDRAKLQAQACECYEVVRKETDRLLPHARP